MSPGLSVAHYRITSKLGKGGMGEVWRATDTKLNREVAIKILPDSFAADPDRLARFSREAQVLAALNHPNVAHIYGVEDRALVMELVEGPTLAERIAQGPIPPGEAIEIARQIGDGLEAAHEKGIVHRDLKPANIKVTPDGRVKVLDFGLAKAMSSDGTTSDPVNSPTLTMRATVAGVILGTAAYMSPEQAKGKPVDRRADIWAFGVVLYEMLTGDSLFTGETVSDTLAAVLTKEPDISRAPARFRKLLEGCLEKDPKRRLRDIGDAWRLIEETTPAASTRPARSPLFPWLVAAAVAIAAGALAFVHFRETPAPAPLVRFGVAPPEKGAFAQSLALSPDGKHLAFTATGADGLLRVWLRSLDSMELRPLTAGDAGTVTLFWSPDSQYVVFQAAAKMRKIAIANGSPQTICDSPAVMLSGSWNATGIILYGNNSGPIMRVSAAGGVPVPATRTETSRNDVYHSDPIFLPDGVHFLYFRHSSKSENQGVFVGSIDVKPEQQSLKLIEPTDFSIAYAAPQAGQSTGHILLLREGMLVAQPFDQRRLEATGEATPIAEQIGTSVTRAFFSVSNTGVLTYRAGSGLSTQLAWLDRQGQSLGVVGEPGDYQEPAISPDGNRVAYSRPIQGSLRQIWIFDITRNTQTRFTFLPEGARTPVWSPNGRLVAFSSVSGPTIYIKDVSNAANPEPILQADSTTIMNDWSPDGRFLVYTQTLNAFDLWAVPAPPGSGERKPFPVANSTFTEMHGQISPNGQWIAYDSNESGLSEIYVRPFPPGDSRTGKWLVSSKGGVQPRWRRDGKELFYLAPDHTLLAVDVRTSPLFEAGSPHSLFTIPSILSNALTAPYDVARDGKRFLMLAQSGNALSTPANIIVNWENLLKK